MKKLIRSKKPNIASLKKDLLNNKNVKELLLFFNTPPKKVSHKDTRRLFFFAVIGFGSLFSLMFLGNIVSIWFVFMLFIWLWFIRRTRSFYIYGNYSFDSMIALFILIFIVSLILLGFNVNSITY